METETLAGYLKRTAFMVWHSDDPAFVPHPQVRDKVAADGSYRPFWGDTMLFFLDNEACRALDDARQTLYGAGLPLSRPLNAAQFHMTLHDLDHTMGCERRWEATRQAAEAALDRLENGTVTLQPVHVFPMMNTSIVVGYRPATEADYRLLSDWFAAFEPLFPVGQPTFHVTLAYFLPDDAGRMETALLSQSIAAADRMPLPTLRLTKDQLVYQRFLDMDQYFTP